MANLGHNITKKSYSVNILFFGTSSFAVPSLHALARSGYFIAGVVTKPDEPVGRGQKLTPPPAKIEAEKLGLPVFQPVTLGDEQLRKDFPEADLYIVAAYGAIIPAEMLLSPHLGALNIHPSLLPRWRGPSPIQFMILNGDIDAGVTIIKLDDLMDHGPIVAQRRLDTLHSPFKILYSTYLELHDYLAKRGADLLIETIPKWIKGEIAPVPQDDTKATYSKILKKDDGRIDWKKPAEKIERMVRAFTPWPGAWTMWPSRDKIYRIRIEEAAVIDDEPPLEEASLASNSAGGPPRGSPGFVWSSDSAPLLVKTGKGSVEIKRLTLQAKKPLDAASFVRGYKEITGSVLI